MNQKLIGRCIWRSSDRFSSVKYETHKHVLNMTLIRAPAIPGQSGLAAGHWKMVLDGEVLRDPELAEALNAAQAIAFKAARGLKV